MNKNAEKNLRVSYIRALERFAKSSINLLKKDDFDLGLFCDRMQKNEANLRKLEAVFLDSKYTKALENYVNLVLNLSQKKDESLRAVLTKEANLLYKLKNQNSYKKEKHKNKIKENL